ncbi:MAG: hypothetical protein FWC54_00810 [Actinomycetia bacterium]|nr:hypothetical protein [Actinomycetes bacterium]
MEKGHTRVPGDCPSATPDYQGLARRALETSLKTDRRGWPVLVQHSLFEPDFFALCKAKLHASGAARPRRRSGLFRCPTRAGHIALDDPAIAALLVRSGLRLLQAESAAGAGAGAGASAGAGNYPLNAAAMLLSFPQLRSLPTDGSGNPMPQLCQDGSAELDPHWTMGFPWLEAAVVERLSAVRLLQRKTGAPKTHSSLISCYHQTQFRRMAAWLLLGEEEIRARIDAEPPLFTTQWGEALRATTERPLFASLIASLYEAVYRALAPANPLRSALAGWFGRP